MCSIRSLVSIEKRYICIITIIVVNCCEKTFSCAYCRKSFVHKYNLLRHQTTHTEDLYIYFTSFCSKNKYATKSNNKCVL